MHRNEHSLVYSQVNAAKGGLCNFVQYLRYSLPPHSKVYAYSNISSKDCSVCVISPQPRPAPYTHFVHVPCAVSCGHFSKIAAYIWCPPAKFNLVSPLVLFYAYPRSPLQMMFQILTFFHFSNMALCLFSSPLCGRLLKGWCTPAR